MNKEATAKKKIRDSAFTTLFGKAKYLRELCKVLSPTTTDEELDNISIVTIQNVPVDDLYNDLGFRIGDKFLFIVEAQSTWTTNIAIRCPMYYFKTLQEEFSEKNINVYGKKIKIPKPEFYVIYTGNKVHNEKIHFTC